METNIRNIKKLLLSFVISVIFISYVIYQQGGKGNIDLGNNIVSNFTENGANPIASVNQPSVRLPTLSPSLTKRSAVYNDGQYIGDTVNAQYGNVKVAVTVSGGKITDVQFLDHPSGRSTSVSINNYAMPILKTEAIKAQSAKVNTVSGATYTSVAFINSLSSALSQA